MLRYSISLKAFLSWNLVKSLIKIDVVVDNYNEFFLKRKLFVKCLKVVCYFFEQVNSDQ